MVGQYVYGKLYIVLVMIVGFIWGAAVKLRSEDKRTK